MTLLSLLLILLPRLDLVYPKLVNAHAEPVVNLALQLFSEDRHVRIDTLDARQYRDARDTRIVAFGPHAEPFAWRGFYRVQTRGWWPTAILIALVVTTPMSRRRRLGALVGGVVLLDALLLLRLGAVVLTSYAASAPDADPRWMRASELARESFASWLPPLLGVLVAWGGLARPRSIDLAATARWLRPEAVAPSAAPWEGRRFLALVLGLYVALGLAYSVLVPVWEAPDESAHYTVALYLAKFDERPPPGFNHEAMQPPLYYWMASRLLRLLDRIDPDLVVHFRPRALSGIAPRFNWNQENYRFLVGPHLLRWLNLSIGALALCLIYAGARRFAPDIPAVSLATVSVAGLTPQFVHISTSVSNDPLATLGGAGLFYATSRICLGVPSRRLLVATALVALTLPVLIKPTVLPMSAAALLGVAWRSRDQATLRFRLLAFGSIIAAVPLVVVVAWTPEALESFWSDLFQRIRYVRPNAFQRSADFALLFAATYWGLVGVVAVGLPTAAVSFLSGAGALGILASLRLLLQRLCAMAPWARPLVAWLCVAPVVLALVARQWLGAPAAAVAAWMLWQSFQRERDPFTRDRLAWAAVWLALAVALAGVGKHYLANPATHGRFLFPANGALALLMASGWFVLLGPRLGRLLPAAIVAGMLIANAVLLVGGVIPTYYQPFLDD